MAVRFGAVIVTVSVPRGFCFLEGWINVIIYKATNKENRKSYIGQTIQALDQRKRKHCWEAIHSDGSCRCFAKALRKYGLKAFDWKVIDTADTLEDLNVLEELWIEAERTVVPGGYNLRTGGENSLPSEKTKKRMSVAQKGKKLSDKTKSKISKALKGRKGRKSSIETRKKISEILKGNKNSVGRKHSSETKQKISEAGKGQKHSEEAKQKMSAARKGRKYSAKTKRKMSEAQKGKHTTLATRRRMSEAQKGKKALNAKAVIINGFPFKTMKLAAIFLGVSRSTLRCRLNSPSEKFANYSYMK